jgi:NhaA family Na+:H+ antiporter
VTPKTTVARVLERLTLPFQRFVALEASSSLLLLGATVAALVWANSPGLAAYEHLLHVPVSATAGPLAVDFTLHHFVNDVLMTVFFFLVGMEIKRELAIGELSSRSRAMLPVVGALGGMVVPALLYAALHRDGPGLRGWGIPMATDIAFAVAALSVFGKRVPTGLQVFLLALAIADDIGAVSVIAVFYTEHVVLAWLAAAALGLGVVEFMKRADVRSYGAYLAVGLAIWYATFQSGVHATIAGVALGLLTPARPVGDRERSPIDELEGGLHGWVAYAVMPLFALFNAGVTIDAQVLGDPLSMRVAAAVALGLLVGKPVGITVFSWAAVRLGVASLPHGVSWGQVVGAGLLAGIGFTVALFVAALAFGESGLDAGAKLGVLVGSVAAAGLGMTALVRATSRSE